MLIAQDRDVRINGEITAPEVRLIGMKGEPIGVVSLAQANAMAEELEIDLVEIAPLAADGLWQVQVQRGQEKT